MLQKNLKSLEVKCPALYDLFKEYKPTRESPIQGATKEQCIAQAAKWIEKPVRIGYSTDHEPSSVCLHLDILNDIYEKRKEEVGEEPINEVIENKLADTMCMFGVGNGQHLIHLLENITINTLILYEPDADVFYSSLDTVDWSFILEKTNVELSIGGDTTSVINRLENYLRREGRFHLARLYLYRHYDSKYTVEAEQILRDNYHKLITGWGFFEDEIQGIQHSRVNMTTSPAINKETTVPDIPVLVVGNGPSLDDSINYIKDNLGGALVVSCGTATPALLANDITPDVHVEMERVYTTKEWIESCDKLEEFKKIPLLHNNTVHPHIVDLFEDTYMVLKANDTGGNILNDGEHIMPLHSNPTCVNLALTTIINMGFKELYLFGLDCGYRDASKHHSKDSSYFKEGFSGNEGMKYEAQFKRPANFGGTVYSERIFDVCRSEIEVLLSKNPHVTALNCSDGAFIEGAVPCKKPLPLDYWWSGDRRSRVIELLSDNSSKVQDKDFDTLMHCGVKTTSERISFYVPEITSYAKKLQKFISTLRRIYIKLVTLTGDELYLQSLFLGSFNYVSTAALSNLYFYRDNEDREDYAYWLGWNIECHFQSLVHRLLKEYDKVDTTFKGWYDASYN